MLMNQLKLENIELALTEENGNVRVKAPGEHIILDKQNIENVISLIGGNFKIVDSFYLKRIADNPMVSFDLNEVHSLSLSIVFYYLYMYNFWRHQYESKETRN
jgi:hypothetical protein